MNNYQFGEKIYKLRKGMGLSQNQLAEMLGLSGKTISKWENGGGLPQIDALKELSIIFGVSTDELLFTETKPKSVTKIVLTGGPCAGKTTALSYIQTHFTEKGYHVIIVPETATELILGGITPWGLNTNLDYQLSQMSLQIEKEKIFFSAAQNVFGKEKIIILNAETLYRKAEYKLSQANFTCCTVPGKSGFEHAVFYSVGGDACVLINNNLIKIWLIRRPISKPCRIKGDLIFVNAFFRRHSKSFI